ncbi:PKS-NRPS hybrid synthetase [Fusarium oxysporum f. sp. conglutinans]|nr:PKS-NRPS hybrid synthetase [Fusarium oxysporum f. sp. conglutinans]
MRGYAFVARRSSKAKTLSQALTVTYVCDRGGGPRSDQASKRKTSSRRTACLFSINAVESSCKTRWAVKHRRDPRTYMHNHEPSYGPRAHPVHRQITSDQEQTVRLLTEAGVKPKEIRTFIRLSDRFCLATQQDIYNAIARSKRDLAKGQSSIHALADELVNQGFRSHFCLDQDNRVTAVFFTNADSLAYTKTYPEVMMLNCTYKTNKYKMPLLDIVGIDACGKSFCIAFAFMSGEEEADYLWVLSRLREVYKAQGIALPSVILTDRCLACMNAIVNAAAFPEPTHLLCIFHINQAILAYCQPQFTRGSDDPQGHSKWLEFQKSFNQIISSETQAVYKERLKKFKDTYALSHRDEVGYIMTTWLNPYKEKFMKGWIRNTLHFGHITTSPAEGIHNLIKRHLNNNQADLFECWRHIKRAVDNQLQSLRDSLAYNNINEPTVQSIRLSRPLFGTVIG